MKKGDIGVVVLPMIFGTSLSTRLRCLALERLGYSAEQVDPYQNQAFGRPFFGQVLRGDERANLAELAARFDDDMVVQEVERAVVHLFHVRGCRHIVLAGFGLGGIYPLMYAQSQSTRLHKVVGVAA